MRIEPLKNHIVEPTLGSVEFKIKLFKNSFWNLASFIVPLLFSFVSVPLYIRYLGLGGYGLFVLLNSILTPAGLLNFGFGQATIKYVSECSGRGLIKEAEKIIRTTLTFNIIMGIVGTGIIIGLSNILINNVFNIPLENRILAINCLYWVAFSWAINQIIATYKAIPTALQNYRVVSIWNSFLTSTGILVGVSTLALGGNLLSFIQFQCYWLIISVFIWGWIANNSFPGISILPGWDMAAFTQSFNFGVWQNIGNFGGLLASQTDKYVLGIFLSPVLVGIYNAAWLLESTLNIFVYKLGETLFPVISNLQGQGEEKVIYNLILKSSWIFGILMVVIMGPLAIFANDILRLYLGSDVANSTDWLTRVLVIAGILSSGSISIGQYMLGTARTKWTAVISLSSGAIIFIFGMILVPQFGLLGAGWSQIFSIILSRPLIHYFFWKKYLSFEIPGKLFFLYLYGPSAIGIPVVLCLSIIRDQFAMNLSWITLGMFSFTTFCTLTIIVITFDRLLPESTQRQQELFNVFSLLKKHIKQVLSIG